MADQGGVSVHETMIRLYHGSQEESVNPTFGIGSSHHDFGAGFYLTDSFDLAREWSVYRPGSGDGWVHAFDLDSAGLKIFDFRDAGVFPWVAELMKHRNADESAAYRRRAPEFIAKYGVDVDDCDVVIGWRADASYFYIVKSFVRDEVDADALPDLLRLGDFGIQYVIKSKRAYSQLHALPELRRRVSFDKFHEAYEQRDGAARDAMRRLIADPAFNKLNRLFSDLTREGR